MTAAGQSSPRTAARASAPGTRGPGPGEVEVPLIGQVPAGIPLDAVEMAEDTFWLPRRLVGHGTLFMLKIKADSMTGAAIADCDLVAVIRPGRQASSRRSD